MTHASEGRLPNTRISEVDLSLYNETFVSRAKVLQCCNICLSELHTTIEYNLVSNSHPTTPATQSAGWHTGEKNQSLSACFIMIVRVTGAHTHQIANTAIPVQHVEEDIPSLSAPTDIHTHMQRGITQT